MRSQESLEKEVLDLRKLCSEHHQKILNLEQENKNLKAMVDGLQKTFTPGLAKEQNNPYQERCTHRDSFGTLCFLHQGHHGPHR